ncbi:citrate/2-methylcitrate synthase [Nonomuraea angiospora]|uniref:citrate/2-methylcitrate synthase n=1 Tax=Nonomuraea angiospora TaxID=46172 RepID=UPI0036131A80
MSTTTEQVTGWWATAISDISPGVIRLHGYPVEQLIGRLSFADTIWLMLRGEVPSPGQSALFEAALVSGVDHGPQAPSIAAARMAATCGVGLNTAVATGVGLLGDVHGGAGQECMAVLADIRERAAPAPAGVDPTGTGLAGSGLAGTGLAGADPTETGVAGTGVAGTGVAGTGVAGTGVAGTGVAGTGVAGTGVAGTGVAGTELVEVVSGVLAGYRGAKRYFPGFGHRFHPRDPRRDPLLRAVEDAVRDGVVEGAYLRIGLEIERQLAPVPMNVDGATAIVYSELGFAPELGRGLFVLSRAVGVLAHAWEEHGEGRRIKGPIPPPLLPAYRGPEPRDLPTDRGPEPRDLPTERDHGAT